ncbi:hypothetical protein [Streptomyces thermolilacinus]|uniref:hypothetical protein n=1 Tax=Streptomyces thermolilacinus TaxID=285540 RepID=UPI00085293ED|nr:hypothetical protein [Streptomyces thermolilacinus]
MSVLAKLLELTAASCQDRDGEDEIVMSRVGGVQFFPTSGTVSMREGSTEELDIFVPVFGDVRLALHEVDRGSGMPARLVGTVSISPDEAGRGTIRKKFEGAGALYELSYVVS